MILEFSDWVVMVLFLAVTMLTGICFRGQAGKSLQDYFLGGRRLSWWVAGTSMVATTFAADTPLAVTELVAKGGVAGNWLWWNMLAGGMLTTFFFAGNWRKVSVLTDLEFIELRYTGRPAAVLRAFRSVYFGVFMNILVIGWVNVALISLLKGFFGLDDTWALAVTGCIMLMVVIYSGVSGLRGIAFADLFQFVTAMSGCLLLAVVVLNSPEIGGMEGLKSSLDPEVFNLFPSLGDPTGGGSGFYLGTASFLTFILIQWWASWYPGSEPGGGGYVAQRMMSAKNERSAWAASLFFQITHFCVRPWPWIIVALCALVLYPELPEQEKRMGFVFVMRDYLPGGLRGLLLVSFIAAYMSTLSTQLNWGCSYLINDLYKRFVRPDADQQHLIKVSRFMVCALMILSLYVTTRIERISDVWNFIVQCGAGLGLVMILRWYWWRINVWSEVSATLAPFVSYGFCKVYLARYVSPNWGMGILENPSSFLLTVFFTSFVWISCTLLTKPEPLPHLKAFCEKVRPSGIWGPLRDYSSGERLYIRVFHWLLSVSLAYSLLFFTGELIFLNYGNAAVFLGLFTLSLAGWLKTGSFLRASEVRCHLRAAMKDSGSESPEQQSDAYKML